jgi:hypothetical protein
VILTPRTYWDAVTEALSCVNQSLIDNEVNGTLGAPGRVLIAPGNEVPWDGCECGQLAAVFQHGPYPSNNFPIENQEGQNNGNCELGSSAVRVLMSLTRCQYHPQGVESPKKVVPPTVAQQNAASLLQQIEAYYMREAHLCCQQDMRDGNPTMIDDFRLGATDYQVNGNCGEVNTLFWLQVV